MASHPYIRLGRRAGLVSRHSLWLGEDHVLAVTSPGFEEQYKRFYLRDIQALILRPTNSWWIVAVSTGGLILLLAAMGGVINDPGFWVLAGVIGVPLLTGFVGNLALGQSAELWVQTAAQTERLSGVGRLRKGRKVIERLTPMISLAQEKLATVAPPESPPEPPPNET